VILSGAILLAVAGYLQALHYPFVNDDTIYVVENTKLAGLQLAELWRLIAEPYNSYEFLPLRDLSYWFDITLFGLTPAAFRVHNIILYLLCLPLIYAATQSLWRYFRQSDTASAPLAAAAVTALFTLHPAHVESVVWIASRKDVLSTLFSLLALWLALKAKQEEGLSRGFASAALFSLLAAMLSKATAVAVAPVIAILWLLFWQDIPLQSRRRSGLMWPLATLILSACIALIFVASSLVKPASYYGVEIVTRALAILGWLARLAISPENRLFYHPVLEGTDFPVMVTIGVGILLVTAVATVRLLRRRSLEAFAVVMFLLLCMPYTQLVPYFTNSLVADRFLTLAVWPFILLIVTLSWRLKTVNRIALLFTLAILWGWQTIERPLNWHSYETLMDADLRAHPGNYLPAYQKIMSFQLPKGRFQEASALANSINFPEAREIMIKLVEVAIDLRDVKKTNDPHNAISHLQSLEDILKKYPVQTKWDPAMMHFWKESQDSFALEWQWLVKSFPGDATVRYNARLSLLNVLQYGIADTQLQTPP
jgi:hypothetical protein